MKTQITKIYPVLGGMNADRAPSEDLAKGEVAGNSDNIIPTVRVEQNIKMVCPKCGGGNFVRRGIRKRRHEKVQLYKCKNPECGRTFTDPALYGRRFPLKVIIDSLSYYNLGFTREQVTNIVKKLHKIAPEAETVSRWAEEYKSYCPYLKMRPYAMQMYSPMEVIDSVSMAHRQLYKFRYHRAKIRLMLEDYKNRNFSPLMEYLDNVSSETPHQYFAEGERMSDVRSRFSASDMVVTSKSNYANRLTEFALQSVSKNKDRHESLQRFFISCDSVTVATEVPVYIRREDVEHMQNELGFQIVGENGLTFKGDGRKRGKQTIEEWEAIQKIKENRNKIPNLLTGHIDFVQVRNGQIHLLDYKPKAVKEKPIEQLTWYALALSRLTGLRLYEFKCAWFDETDYFEFYPLHVVKKLQGKSRRKIYYRSGAMAVLPKKDILTVIK